MAKNNTIQRSYQFRLYPSAVQLILLAQYFGAARWVWNTALAWRSHCYKVLGERVSGVDFSREMTFLKTLAPFAWLKAVPATILTQTLRDQDQAFSNFFAKRALSALQEAPGRRLDPLPARSALRDEHLPRGRVTQAPRPGCANAALVAGSWRGAEDGHTAP